MIIDPVADGRIGDPGYIAPGEERFIGPSFSTVRAVDQEQLHPVPEPPTRRGFQYLYMMFRPLWPHLRWPTNTGEKIIVDPYAEYGQPQIQNPADIFRRDSIRMIPEPWSVNLPQGSGL